MTDKASNEFYEMQMWGKEVSRFYNTITKESIKGKTVLEIGCGAGASLMFMKETLKPKKLIGVDISENAIAEVKKKGIEGYCVDSGKQKLPFKDNTFDTLITFEVVEHVFDTDFFINEIKRVLKPKGKLYLSTPNLAWWANRLMFSFGFQPAHTEVNLKNSMLGKPKLFNDGTPAGHIHVFTYKAIKEFLVSKKLKIIKIHPISYFVNPTGIIKAAKLSDEILKFKGLAAYHVFICENTK